MQVQRLSWLDERLATYQNIKRKYKSSIDDIFTKKERFGIRS